MRAKTNTGTGPLFERDLRLAMLRGARGRCANCGKGALFRSYLKQVDCCSHCAEPFAHIRADDGPAWLTILIVGHIVVAIAMAVEIGATWPVWWSMVLFCTLALAMTLLLLPRAKGIFIGAIWAQRLAQTDLT